MKPTFALIATILLSPWTLAAIPSDSDGGPSPATTAEAAAEATVEAFHEALAAGNRDAVLLTLDDDVVIFESGGAEMTKGEYAQHHLEGDLAFSAVVEREIIDRSSRSDGASAWVLTRSRTRGTYRERVLDLVGTETMILRRTGEGWRVVHVHWSSRPWS